MQSLLDDLHSGAFGRELVEMNSKIVLSPEEKSFRRECALRRLAHYEAVGDKFFAAVEREQIELRLT